MEHMETVYEVVFDRCGTATTKRATYIPKNSANNGFAYSEREVMPRERRRLSLESNDRRARYDDSNDRSESNRDGASSKLDLRSSRGRRRSDHVRHTFSVSV